MSEYRWSKFWWQDWQSDAALRSCSLAARGLWMEMLCLAHDGTPRGHVTIAGKAVSSKRLAVLAGIPEKECNKLLAELREADVFSETPDGTVFSRRMVRDTEAAAAGREAVTKRWGKRDAPKPDPTEDPITPPNRGNDRGAITLEAEADTEAEKKDSKSFLDAATGEREAVDNSQPSEPTVLPSSVTATVSSLTARLEGRARGQPFLTAKPPARTVEQQLAAVAPPAIRPRHAPPDVLAAARQALAARAKEGQC